jgi:hypothetical protein
MTEHGWPDHHDDHGYHDEHHDPLHEPDDSAAHDVDQAPLPDDDHGYFDVDHAPPPDEPHIAPVDEHEVTPELQHEVEPDFQHDFEHDFPHDEAQPVVGTDPDALPDYDSTDTVFPPTVDVGPLPEPVDGFPWIDTGSLGVVDPAALHDTPADAVDPHELAEYAGTELPPGVDPWATLADSEDPATSALARWWSQQQG